MPRSMLLVTALVLVLLALPSTAFGQATRTWVSGVGDDANPCSRTAPCKTYAGAISKTANGGVINVLDPGGFGGVTITKSLTIRARGNTAGALVSGTNAIVVNATATDKVTIDGLDINGIGTGAPTSLSGIKILSAGRVNIVNNEITRFRAGVVMAPTPAASQARVVLSNNHIFDNGVGVINAPGNNGITNTVATLRNNLINDNVCGVASGAFGTNASTPDASVNCGTAAAGAIDKVTATRMTGNAIFDNQFGVFSRGLNSTVDLSNNDVVGNTSFGIRRLDGGILRTTVPATNFLRNNADDTTNATTNLG